MSDLHARYILGLTALPSVVATCRTLVQDFGLPNVIRTDNGVPFGAPTALGGLSTLAVWWIRLGIRPERIHKGAPQENDAHERMHRTLKAETTRPVAASLPAQQRHFVQWQRTFNAMRPHEALGQTPPAAHYAPSRRLFPSGYSHSHTRSITRCDASPPAVAFGWRGASSFSAKCCSTST